MSEVTSRIFSAYEKDEFFSIMRAQALDLAYDDVRVATGPSDYDENGIDLTSRFSRNVSLKVPFISAAMDTVTTSTMAIAMAKLGCLGVIHAGMDPKEQRNEVRRVKYHLSGVIQEPVAYQQDESLQSILADCEERQLDFRTFPVIDAQGKVVGVLTQNDFDRSRQRSAVITAGDAMTPLAELTFALPETGVEDAYRIMQDSRKKTVPLLNPDGTVAGLYVWSDVDRIISGDSAMFNVDARGRLRTAAALATDENIAVERVRLMREYLDVAVIDTSKGDHTYARRTLKLLKQEFPDLDVVIGNVSEPEGAFVLANDGADGIKVGQGPGSICTTRMEIGIGAPQVTAIYNCVEAVRGMDVPICADGGIQNRGDLTVAIATGADSIMAGGMWAGTDETPGKVERDSEGKLVKWYRGMGSEDAIKDSRVARRGYDSVGSVLLPEGVKKAIPYKGSVVEIVQKAAIALRRGISMGRSPSVAHFQQHARFRRPTPAGINEGRPHDVEAVS